MALATLPQAANTPFLMDNPVFDPGQFAAMMQVAEMMAKAKLVPEHLQNKPADCLLVVEQSRRWNMSPFAVAQETYVVKGKLLFGGKLVTAVINSRAPVRAPLKFEFEGEGDKCRVTVSATLKAEDEPRTYSITVGEAKAVAGNSTLWKTDPKQQATYFAARFWARRHCPETILGVWGEDEIEAPPMRDVTPPSAADHARASAPPPTDILVIDPEGEERGLTPGEAPELIRQWARECTDEQLGWLAENNESVELVARIVEAERTVRATKTKAPEQDGDPLRVRGKPAKEFVETLQWELERCDAARAYQINEVYRDLIEKLPPKIKEGLDKIVADRIEAEFSSEKRGEEQGELV